MVGFVVILMGGCMGKRHKLKIPRTYKQNLVTCLKEEKKFRKTAYA